jgi:hypothetical protein
MPDFNAARALVASTTKGGRVNWINLQALEYALFEYDADSKEQRIVLVELYYHSDPDSGYTYPSVKGIAQRWGMDRETVRGQVSELLVRRAIFPTKKRKGGTGQIKVYRLPKFLWQRGSQTAPLRDGKEMEKGRERGGEEVARPPRTRNKEQGTKNNSEKRAEHSSSPSIGNGQMAPYIHSFLDSLSSRKEERQEPTWFHEIRAMYPGTTVDEDLKQIEEWARKKRKKFTRDLALNALRRNPPKKPGQRDGFVYHGKFIGYKDAIDLAVKDTEFQLNAKRAIRYADGRIEIMSNAA